MGKQDYDDMLHLSVTMGAVLLYSHLLRTPEIIILIWEDTEDEKENHNSTVEHEKEVYCKQDQMQKAATSYLYLLPE